MIVIEFRRSELAATKLSLRTLASPSGALRDGMDWGENIMKSHWLRPVVPSAAWAPLRGGMEMARRSIACGLTLVLAFCGIQLAAAADLPAATPVYKAAPSVAPYNWTGFYIGGNLGYSWGRADTGTDITGFLGPTSTLVHSDALKLNGAVGGGQIGYNWQVSPNWVYGLEADWQGSSENGGVNHNDPYSLVVPGIGMITSGTLTTNAEAKISWFGTVRGRIGYAWDHLLIYGTGGLAYGGVRLSGTAMDSGTFFAGTYSGTSPFSASRVNAGWTAGAGIEGALASSWTWKIEYLYLDLGSLNFSGLGPFSYETVTAHARFNDNIVRAGLNFQFH
jgi:outer membrane immunogenic protein